MEDFKNHRTVKIGQWALALGWALAWDNMVIHSSAHRFSSCSGDKLYGSKEQGGSVSTVWGDVHLAWKHVWPFNLYICWSALVDVILTHVYSFLLGWLSGIYTEACSF